MLAIAIIILLILAPIWKGYILSILWSWFIVTTFGLPQISIPVAIGIALIMAMFTSHLINNNTSDTDDGLYKSFTRLVATSYMFPTIILSVGWVATKFM